MIYKAPFVNLQSHENFDKQVLTWAFQLDGSIPILYWIDRPLFVNLLVMLFTTLNPIGWFET
jgi:hypothetical protein